MLRRPPLTSARPRRARTRASTGYKTAAIPKNLFAANDHTKIPDRRVSFDAVLRIAALVVIVVYGLNRR